MNKNKTFTLTLAILFFHAGSVYALPTPQSLRSSYDSIKIVLSGTRTTSTLQRDLIKWINTGRMAYQVPKIGDTSTKTRHLLSLTQARGDISMTEVTRLGASYRVLGDAAPHALSRCLNTPHCDHAAFITNQQRSSLHQNMSWQMPHLSPSAINHKVGELNERVMNRYYTSSGWRQLPGEIGRNGIDGLFVKYRRDGSIRDVLISESKYNFSPLGNTLHGRQMSQQWTLRKIDDLYRTTRDPRYREVQRFVEQGSYRNILWRLTPASDNSGVFVIQRQRVSDNAGILSFDEIRGGHRMLVDRVANQTINITQPANTFQAGMTRHIQNAFDDIVGEEYSRMALR